MTGGRNLNTIWRFFFALKRKVDVMHFTALNVSSEYWLVIRTWWRDFLWLCFQCCAGISSTHVECLVLSARHICWFIVALLTCLLVWPLVCNIVIEWEMLRTVSYGYNMHSIVICRAVFSSFKDRGKVPSYNACHYLWVLSSAVDAKL